MFINGSLSLNKRSYLHYVFLCACILAGLLVFAGSAYAIEWEGDEKIGVLEAFVAGEYDIDGEEDTTESSTLDSRNFTRAASLQMNSSVLVPVYESDFSSDPNWTTDAPGNFYWHASSSALFAKAETFPPTYQPNRYFVTETELDPTRSFTLEADIMILEFDRSGAVTFGLYAEDLRSSNQVGAGMPRSNGTLNVVLFKLNTNDRFWENNIVDKDRNNLGAGGFTYPAHDLNTWYHVVFTYDVETATVTMLVTNKETGALHRTRTRTGVHFNPAMNFLGIALNPEGLPGTNMSFATDLGGSASFLLDNVVLKQVSDNSAPQISNLAQYKMFGIDTISEGETFVGNAAVFKADVADLDGDDVHIEVELIPTNGDASQSYSSDTASSGTAFTVSVEELIPKDKHYIEGGNEQAFRWRARAVDSRGVSSDWHDYSTAENVDFTVKVVPLWTQGTSDFPSQEQTEIWAGENYANGVDARPGGCGRSIGECGCAISSMIMLGRYYGIESDVTGQSINPLNINSWMTNYSGYQYPGLVKWSKSIEYMGRKDGNESKVYLTLDEYNTTDIDIVNSSLANNAPVVAYSNRYGHYFVIDNQLPNTYSIRDPLWYNTLTLNDTQNYANEVQAYGNVFDKANVFSYHPETTSLAGDIYLFLASPAELLVTDSSGKRLGVDPITDNTYTEIPNATYTQEGNIISSDTPLDNDDIHLTKVIRITNAVAGDYSVEVIGTGEGEYRLSSFIYDGLGNSTTTMYVGIIAENQIDSFILKFTPEDLNQIQIASESPIELFEGVLKSLRNTVTTPDALGAVWQTQVLLAKSKYEQGSIHNAVVLLKAVDKRIEKMKDKALTESVGATIRNKIEKLIAILEAN